MLFGPALIVPPLLLAVTLADLPRPDPEAVETRVAAAIHARADWREGDHLRFGMLKSVTCREGLLRREKHQAWAMEFTWSHAATGASQRLHVQVPQNGQPAVADGAVEEIGSGCRWTE